MLGVDEPKKCRLGPKNNPESLGLEKIVEKLPRCGTIMN
jgi:hypothetical protein